MEVLFKHYQAIWRGGRRSLHSWAEIPRARHQIKEQPDLSVDLLKLLSNWSAISELGVVVVSYTIVAFYMRRSG